MKYLKYLALLLFVLAVYFPVCLHLDALTIRDWDESRLACNAFEMSKDNNFIVTHFEQLPDMWNTKPPLMIWLQVICIKLIGAGELAIRIPSAIAVLLTIFVIIFFCRKLFENELLGYIAALVLISSNGYISIHVARTGDYDALLTLFLTFYSFCFFYYIYKGDKHSNKYLYLTFIGITLAVLTKGISGFFFTPMLLLLALAKKKVILLLKNRHFYFSLAILIVFGIGYYVLREQYNPGYIKAVFENELGGRYLNTLEAHRHEFSWYFFNIYNFGFPYWFMIIPLSLVLLISGIFNQNLLLLRFLLYSFATVIIFFFIISSSQTKLEWYDAPLYPFLSIICAYPITLLLKSILLTEKIKKQVLKYLISALLIFIIFFQPYKAVVSKIYFEENYNYNQLLFGYCMKEMKKYKSYKISYEGYNAQTEFYQNVYNDKGYKIQLTKPTQLKCNDTVMVCETNVINNINQKFHFRIIESWNKCKLIYLENIRN